MAKYYVGQKVVVNSPLGDEYFGTVVEIKYLGTDCAYVVETGIDEYYLVYYEEDIRECC